MKAPYLNLRNTQITPMVQSKCIECFYIVYFFTLEQNSEPESENTTTGLVN